MRILLQHSRMYFHAACIRHTRFAKNALNQKRLVDRDPFAWNSDYVGRGSADRLAHRKNLSSHSLRNTQRRSRIIVSLRRKTWLSSYVKEGLIRLISTARGTSGSFNPLVRLEATFFARISHEIHEFHKIVSKSERGRERKESASGSIDSLEVSSRMTRNLAKMRP